MFDGPVQPLGEVEEPALLAPVLDVPEFDEYELLADMREAQVMQGMEYARDLESIARLARRRPRRGELAAAGGRGGPGVDSRASADAVLARVREDFMAELAVSR